MTIFSPQNWERYAVDLDRERWIRAFRSSSHSSLSWLMNETLEALKTRLGTHINDEIVLI